MGTFIEYWFLGALIFWLYNWLFLYPDTFSELLDHSFKTNNLELFEAVHGWVRLIISTLITNILIWPFSLSMLLVLGITKYRTQFIEVYKKRYVNK